MDISDICQLILSHIDDGTTYKAVRLVSHDFYHSAGNRINEFMNLLCTLVEKFPDRGWNWKDLSGNPNIKLNTIKKFLTKNWEWYHISENITITWDQVLANPNLPWDYRGLQNNINITPEIILANTECFFEWKYSNGNLNHYCNPFQLDEMISSDKYPGLTYCYYQHLSKNSKLTWEYIKKNIDKNWNWYYIIKNRCITWDHISNKELKPYLCWSAISQNPNITPKIISDNFQKPWNWFDMTFNPNLFTLDNVHDMWQLIKNHPEIDWYWDKLIQLLDWDIIFNNWQYIKSKSDYIYYSRQNQKQKTTI